MINIKKLRECVSDGLDYIKKRQDVESAEIFASYNDPLVNRLINTSDILCVGMEPKNSIWWGVGVLATFRRHGKLYVGHGYESSCASLKGVKRALAKAKENAKLDPHFKSLSQPLKEKPTLNDYHDKTFMEMEGKELARALVKAGGKVIEGADDTFAKAGQSRTLVINGDVSLVKEKMAVGNTLGINEYDQSTVFMARITSMIERGFSKGTGYAVGAGSFADFHPEEAGIEAAQSAISGLGGREIASGEYPVVLGPQPVTELLSNLILRSLNMYSIDATSTPFLGKLGEEIAWKNLNLYDDASRPGFLASKRVTCEGIPTGRVDLIKEGRLVGFLSDNYMAKKWSNLLKEIVPRNGFRFSSGGGRDYRFRGGACATNVFVEGTKEVPREELISQVGNGVYIGRIWYTYPINLMGPGDFTGTVIADSYLIKNGKIAEPLKPNKVRINDNFLDLLKGIKGISKEKKHALIWAAEEIVVAPTILVEKLKLERIAKFMANFEK